MYKCTFLETLYTTLKEYLMLKQFFVFRMRTLFFTVNYNTPIYIMIRVYIMYNIIYMRTYL